MSEETEARGPDFPAESIDFNKVNDACLKNPFAGDEAMKGAIHRVAQVPDGSYEIVQKGGGWKHVLDSSGEVAFKSRSDEEAQAWIDNETGSSIEGELDGSSEGDRSSEDPPSDSSAGGTTTEAADKTAGTGEQE